MKYFVKQNDKRSIELAKLLKKSNSVSHVYTKADSFDACFLGIDGKEYENYEFLPNCHIYTLIDNPKFHHYPYYFSLYQDYQLVKENTALTSEALIGYMITNTEEGIIHKNVLILGYGNCGKDLSKKLKPFQCHITISNRGNIYQKNIEQNGFRYIPLETLSLNSFDYVINTIPVCILTKELLDTAKKDVKIFDISSKPYGALEKDRTNHYQILNSLPTKYAYKASAKRLYDAITKREEYYAKG